MVAGRLRITARYFRVSGFTFEPNAKNEALVWVDARNVEVSLNEIRNGTSSCVFGGSDQCGSRRTGSTTAARTTSTASRRITGSTGTGGNDSVIANNVIERAIGFGIQVHPYTSSNSRNVIRDNTIVANGRLTGGSQGASGIILDGSVTSYTVVRNNVVAW